MAKIFDKQTGAEIGTLTDEQLQFLIDHLEEESEEDDDYYLNRTTVDVLQEEGADPGLVELLRGALGNREDMDIRWSRE